MLCRIAGGLRRVALPGLLSALALTAQAQNGQRSPEGANDWSCRPSSERPRPVILVHGTSSNMAENWSVLAPVLKQRGYCVFALNYGANAYSAGSMYGLAPVADSARELALFVDEVLDATGAAKVDIVGHSQGGTMPRWYLKFLGGAGEVNALIGIAPINHGTDTFGMAPWAQQFPWAVNVLGMWCAACGDLLSGSAFLRRLNAGGDTVPGVKYTVIATRNDDIVTPYESQFLQGPNVTNIVLQDHCPQHRRFHEELAFDATTVQLVVQALERRNGRPVACS